MTNHDHESTGDATTPQPEAVRRPKPRARVLMIPALIVLGLLAIILGRIGPREHDDPIIIDNPGVEIYRLKEKHNPTKVIFSDKWSIGSVGTIDYILVKSTFKGTTETIRESPSDSDIFTFYKIVKDGLPVASFVIRKEDILVLFKRATVAPAPNSTVTLKQLPGRNRIKLEENGGDIRIGQIAFGNTVVCVADDPVPQTNKCANGRHTPDAIKIEIHLKH